MNDIQASRPPASTVDLHMHTTCSDGSLTPTKLITAAAQAGLRTIAVTDHDTVDGLREAREAADAHGIQLIPGVELSASWERRTVHIVGLGIDPSAPALEDAIGQMQALRRERALAIAQRLEKVGAGEMQAWTADQLSRGQVTRSHFAQRLVALGLCKDGKQAFKRYLAQGKSAYAPVQWMSMENAIGCLQAAGGVAILAHPLTYPLTRNGRHRLIRAFKAAGGSALEVCSGRATADSVQTCSADALQFGLHASLGSDYHGASQPWIQLGRLQPLPSTQQSVLGLLDRS